MTLPPPEKVCILFADIDASSGLNNVSLHWLTTQLMQNAGELLRQSKDMVLCKNTWGDGLFCVFKDQALRAAKFALELRKTFIELGNSKHLSPPPSIRIALHYGEAFRIKDRVTNRYNYVGQDVITAARIEPVVQSNEVFVSNSFHSELTRASINFSKEGIQIVQIGRVPLAKSRGAEELWWIGENGEEFSLDKYVSARNLSLAKEFSPVYSQRQADELRKSIYRIASQKADEATGGKLYSFFLNDPQGEYTDFYPEVKHVVQSGKLEFRRITVRETDLEAIRQDLVLPDKHLVNLFKQTADLPARQMIPNGIVYRHTGLKEYRAFVSFCRMGGQPALAIYSERQEVVNDLISRLDTYIGGLLRH